MKTIRYAIVILLVSFACSGCSFGWLKFAIKPKAAATAAETMTGIESSWGVLKGKKLTILYSNTTNGTLRSCGCPGHPYGGLPQRAQVINLLRRQDPGLLLFDSGDILSALYSPTKERDKEKAKYLWAAYQAMDYDAIGIGDQDLILGVAHFEKTQKQYQLPFVSATLLKLPSNDPLAQEQMFLKRKRLNIAVTSVIGPRTFFFFPQKNELMGRILVKEPDKFLESRLPTYKKAADLVIVISHLGVDRDKKLAQAFPDIDLIVGGHTQTLLAPPLRVGETIIVQAGSSGENLGKLTLYLARNKTVQGYTNIIIPLNEQIPPDPVVGAIVEEYSRKENSELIPQEIKEMAKERDYRYPEANCASCHWEENQVWVKSKHRQAYQTLKRVGRTGELECFFCHVSGYGYPGGFINEKKTPQLAAVGCLNCHFNVQRQKIKIRSLAFTEKKKICLGCHTKEKSPDFDYDAYWDMIRH